MTAPAPGAPVYDELGRGYRRTRATDPRVARAIRAALGDATTLLNVGAGAGSYEPADLRVVAVEPSGEMLRQRERGAAPAVRARAERLPFGDASFDAALAVLTVHHWSDRAAGLAELRRVARRRVVVVTWDPGARRAFWLTDHYLPEVLALDLPRFPSLEELDRSWGGARWEPLLVPHDCADGFLGAFWRRPEAYLDPRVRQGISCFAQLPREVVEAGLGRLAADLRSGRWDASWGHLRGRDTADLGYRIAVADRTCGVAAPPTGVQARPPGEGAA